MSKICSYAQGFAQMRAASEEYNWDLNYGDIAMIFRGGCIIRAQFLQKIKEAYDRNPEFGELNIRSIFKEIVESYQASLRKVISPQIDMVSLFHVSQVHLLTMTATVQKHCLRIFTGTA